MGCYIAILIKDSKLKSTTQLANSLFKLPYRIPLHNNSFKIEISMIKINAHARTTILKPEYNANNTKIFTCSTVMDILTLSRRNLNNNNDY